MGNAGVLGSATTMAELGGDLGGGLTMREVAYLRENEWAVTAEDILYRRSKIGLHVPPDISERLTAFLSSAAAPSIR